MSAPKERRDIFNFILERVKEVSASTGLAKYRAFPRWFTHLYFEQPSEYFAADGPGDGKVDAFFKTTNGASATQHVVNTKFTEAYNRSAPVAFYNEVAQFGTAFEDRSARSAYLGKLAAGLRPHYEGLLRAYDEDRAKLMFVTNLRLDDGRIGELGDTPVELFGLDHLVQHVVDDLDKAMPRTRPMTLKGIQTVLAADKDDTEVSTSIVFARLVDFIDYMKDDKFDLLFARNVRVDIPRSRSATNTAIYETFRDRPREFAYSNNGITVLCEKQVPDPGAKELTLVNPRVVNGSQTLHQVREVANPSKNGRVMVRIIELPPAKGAEKQEYRKRIINNIAVRSNQQNPMKKWSLVSNDDFQLGLYRFFRQRGLFYEHREGEWRKRSRELASVSIEKGPSIKRMAQLIASHLQDKPGLGPAEARRSVGLLFEGQKYKHITEAKPDLAYQLFMIDDYVSSAYRLIAANGAAYLREMRGHADLVVFAMVTSSLKAAGAGFGSPSFTEALKEQWEGDSWRESAWKALVKEIAKRIHAVYGDVSKQHSKTEEKELTLNNFFKTEKYAKKALAKAPSGLIVKAKAAIK